MLIENIHYPVQRVKESHIINIKVDTDALINACSLNNFEYGKGREVIYDFERVQKNVVKDLLNKKYLTTSKLDYF